LGLIWPQKEGEGSSVGADQRLFFKIKISIFLISKFWRHLTKKMRKINQICTRKGKNSQKFPNSQNFPISLLKNLPQKKKTTGVDLVPHFEECSLGANV
jgi:hypothetical protein